MHSAIIAMMHNLTIVIIFLDYSPAVPTGTVITYKCPEFHVFEDDYLRQPILRIECKEDGSFNAPETWSKCINRNYIVKNEH